WQIRSQTDNLGVLRLLDRGELVAQLNVTPWESAKAGEHIRPEELRRHVEQTKDFTVDEFLQTGEVPSQGKNWVYRMSVVGQARGIRTMQNYFAIASPTGEQVILTFTTEVAQASKLGERDLEIVGTLGFSTGK